MLQTQNSKVVTTSPLHFARFEFKYILPAKKRDAVEGSLVNFLQYDPFIEKQTDHNYFVRSLYYDDRLYSAFNDKIDGLHSRAKFRVRTYTTNPDQDVPLFLEVKGRHNNLVYKHRSPLRTQGIDWVGTTGKNMSSAILRPVVVRSTASSIRIREIHEPSSN